MKFYRMMNGDIVTNVTLVMGGSALKAVRVFDLKNNHYCFEPRVYHDGVKERLSGAAAVVIRNQLNRAVKTGQGMVVVEEESPHPFGVPKSWLLKAKGAIHDYTA